MYLWKEVPFQPVGSFVWFTVEIALVEVMTVLGSSFGKIVLQFAVLLHTF